VFVRRAQITVKQRSNLTPYAPQAVFSSPIRAIGPADATANAKIPPANGLNYQSVS